jgi:PAS domain S-box-containing protein
MFLRIRVIRQEIRRMKEHQHHPRIAGIGSVGRHAIVLLIAVLVTAAVFWQLRRAQLAEFRSQFENDAATCTALIRQETDKSLFAIKSLGWFIDGTGSLNASTFQAFAAACLPERKELQALSWNPRVSASERPGFEQKARQEGLNQFHITEQGPDGRPVAAREREVHYPVLYIEPLRGNETAVGFDVGSDPVRQAALERARDTGAPVVTEPIHLVQHERGAVGFLIFVPVYREQLTAGVAQRRAALKGFAVGVYEAGAVVSAALWGVESRGLSLAFLDRLAPVGRQLIYRWDDSLKGSRSWKSILFPTPPKATGTFSFAGRRWGVEVLAGPAYMQRYCPISCWLVWPAGLLLGLVTTSYLGAMLSGRKEADEALRESEARYRAVVENSPDGMAVSIDNKLAYVNPAAVRLAGARGAADLLGRSVVDFVHEDYRAEVERRRVKMLETGLPSPVLESKLRRPDGRIIVAESTGVPILYGGKPAILNSFRDVTEHRRRDQALRASEARYRQLHESMMDAFVAADLNGQLTECNETFRQMLGYEPDEILTLKIEDFTPQKWRAFEDKIRQTQTLGRGYSDIYEKEYRRKDGTVFPVELRAVLLRDDAGQPCGTWAIVRDITGRKQAEEALRQSREQLRQRAEELETITGNAPVALWVAHDPQCNHISGNRMANGLAAASPPPNWSANVSAALRWYRDGRELPPEELPMQRAALKNTEIHNTEIQLLLPSGRQVDLLGSAVPLRDAQGCVRGCVGAFLDNTDRKQAEGLLAGEKRVLEWIARRKPLPEVLTEICRFIDELSPGVMSSILLLDPDGRQLRPVAAPRLPEDWTRAITPLAIGPSVGSCGTAAWDKAQVIVSDIATDPRWTAYPEFGALALRFGLRACWSTPILSAENQLLGTFAMYYGEPRSPSAKDLDVLRQVTHLASVAIEHHRAVEAQCRAQEELEQRVRERTAELVQANRRLEELDRLKSQFLATMSHELRTPLNSIIGFTSILRKRFAGPVNEEQDKQLGLVFGSARHLLSLINDLLDLSRIEAGKVEIESERFNFVEVIEEVVRSLTPLAGQKQLRLATDLPGPAIEMVGDRKRAYQVLLNLANNAVKFTDHGEVKITARAGQDQLRVCVADTGIGIKPEQIGMLFEAFRQLDGTARRVYEGTGLGLHLCRRLLTLMHGEIGVESEFGKGSRFTFTLPRHSNGQPEPRERL